MAFKAASGYYYTERRVPGYGPLPRLSLGTKRKTEAKLLEGAILQVGREALTRPDLFALLDALRPRGPGRSGTLSPADLLRATHEDGGLERLLVSLTDPLFASVLDTYAARDLTREENIVLTVTRTLHRYSGSGDMLSRYLDGREITALLERVEAGEGKLRNSVVRYEKRTLSKLLTWKLGKAERNRIFAEVEYAEMDDRRRLRADVCTPEAMRRLVAELEAGYWTEGDELAPVYAEIAMRTGAEIQPLSKTLNHNLTDSPDGAPGWGRLYLEGTKEILPGERRDRHIWITPALMAFVRRYHRPDEPDERLFPLTKERFDTMFQKARLRAGLMRATLRGEPLRPHDLRRVFAAAAEKSGVDKTTFGSGGLGHRDPEQTDRYLAREAPMTTADVGRIDDWFGGAGRRAV